MKHSELVPALLAGSKIAVGEFRGFEVRELPDSKNQGSYNVITSTFVLCGREVASVETFAEKGKRKADIQPPALTVGQPVVVKFRSWENTKFGTRVRGEVEALLKA